MLRFSHGYALMIGVGYDLPATVKDANLLASILVDPQRCAFPENQVKLLVEHSADRNGILTGLNWLAKAAINDPKASIFVYFSGHGGNTPQYHLVPYGYDHNALDSTALAGSEFTQILTSIQSQKMLVMLDCCHAGGMADVKADVFQSAPMPPDFESAFTAGHGRVVIASSRKDEYSFVGPEYSRFTMAAVEALIGYGASENDGFVRVGDLAMYVSETVPLHTQQRQHPVLKFSKADNFVIAFYAGGEKTARHFHWRTPEVRPNEPTPTSSMQNPPTNVNVVEQHGQTNINVSGTGNNVTSIVNCTGTSNQHPEQGTPSYPPESSNESSIFSQNASTSFTEKRRLARALSNCLCMSEANTREMIVNDLPTEVRSVIRRSPAVLTDIMSIVSTCLNYPGALEQLISTVEFYEGKSHSFEEVKAIVNQILRSA